MKQRVRIKPLDISTAPHLRNVVLEQKKQTKWKVVSILCKMVDRDTAKRIAATYQRQL